jgi:hypothetical protein
MKIAFDVGILSKQMDKQAPAARERIEKELLN